MVILSMMVILSKEFVFVFEFFEAFNGSMNSE